MSLVSYANPKKIQLELDSEINNKEFKFGHEYTCEKQVHVAYEMIASSNNCTDTLFVKIMIGQ